MGSYENQFRISQHNERIWVTIKKYFDTRLKNIQDLSVTPVPWGAMKINLESVNKMKGYKSPFKNIFKLD